MYILLLGTSLELWNFLVAVKIVVTVLGYKLSIDDNDSYRLTAGLTVIALGNSISLVNILYVCVRI